MAEDAEDDYAVIGSEFVEEDDELTPTEILANKLRACPGNTLSVDRSVINMSSPACEHIMMEEVDEEDDMISCVLVCKCGIREAVLIKLKTESEKSGDPDLDEFMEQVGTDTWDR